MCLTKLSFIYDLHTEDNKGSFNHAHLAKSLINKNNEITLKITLLSRLYFPEVDNIDLQDANWHAYYLIKDIADNKTPADEKYTNAMYFINKFTDRILKL